MNCPKCKKEKNCKSGIIKGRQRYKCKDCKYYYTVEQRAGTADKATKRQALELYLEGLGFRSIGRLLKFSNVSILNWIRSFGAQVQDLRAEHPVKIIELDEMHTYIGSKKNIAGYGLLLIEMQKDSSTAHWVQGELSQGKSSGVPSKILPQET